MTSTRTAYDRLRHWSEVAGGRTAVRVWRDGTTARALTYRELLATAEQAAAALRRMGVPPAARVVLVLPNDESFPGALLGCVAAGAVAVPAPVPTSRRSVAFRERIRGMVADCRPTIVLTREDWRSAVAAALPELTAEAIVAWESVSGPATDAAALPAATLPAAAGSAVCLLQYTSGSTGRPKGVVVTHDMLAAQCGQASQVYGERADDVAVTWVPLYHDMGLITGLIRPVYAGYQSVLLRPEDFVSTPRVWLEAVHANRGTLSSAPNFGYELCVRKIAPETITGWDLSSWRVARNAGEMVRADTADRFVRRFAAAGFSPAAFCPSYGLAEATLTVTACTPAEPAIRVTVGQDDVDRGVVQPHDVPAGPDAAAVSNGASGSSPVRGDAAPRRILLSSGVPLPGTRVFIRGADTVPGRIGDVMVSGPQVSPGYWPVDPGTTRDALDTGDIGFLHRGHLFVLGRRDHMLIVHGRNYFPEDIAAACAEVQGIRPGRTAAFHARSPDEDRESVWCVAEVTAGAPPEATAVRQLEREIQRRVAAGTGLHLTRVGLLPAGLMPVTTSGKVRVSQVRRQVEDGSLGLLHGGRTPPSRTGSVERAERGRR
jgi:acyl-CoA synthetase (AMP-forming)/AMP-acid ligase II